MVSKLLHASLATFLTDTVSGVGEWPEGMGCHWGRVLALQCRDPQGGYAEECLGVCMLQQRAQQLYNTYKNDMSWLNFPTPIWMLAISDMSTHHSLGRTT